VGIDLGGGPCCTYLARDSASTHTLSLINAGFRACTTPVSEEHDWYEQRWEGTAISSHVRPQLALCPYFTKMDSKTFSSCTRYFEKRGAVLDGEIDLKNSILKAVRACISWQVARLQVLKNLSI
jgi:hypothetical protein